MPVPYCKKRVLLCRMLCLSFPYCKNPMLCLSFPYCKNPMLLCRVLCLSSPYCKNPMLLCRVLCLSSPYYKNPMLLCRVLCLSSLYCKNPMLLSMVLYLSSPYCKNPMLLCRVLCLSSPYHPGWSYRTLAVLVRSIGLCWHLPTASCGSHAIGWSNSRKTVRENAKWRLPRNLMFVLTVLSV